MGSRGPVAHLGVKEGVVVKEIRGGGEDWHGEEGKELFNAFKSREIVKVVIS